MGYVKKDSLIMVYAVFPKSFKFKGQVSELLKKNIIVCANVISGMESHYMWKGKIERSKETVIIFKTLSRFERPLFAAIKKFHPYETPFIAVIKPEKINIEYLNYAVEQQSSKIK